VLTNGWRFYIISHGSIFVVSLEVHGLLHDVKLLILFSIHIWRSIYAKCNRSFAEAGVMEKLGIYLKLAKDCMEAVQGMSPRKFNNEQCEYLADKLEAVVQSASLFLEDSQAQLHGPCSSVDIAREVKIFKLLLALAKQIESFVQGCCKEAWMQAAMTLANVGEYVSSLGFNLELCRVALGKDHAATGSLTLEEVGKINKDEVEIVEKKALIDRESLLKRVTLELDSSKAENGDLARYLLHRVVKVGPNPTIDDDNVLVKLFEWVISGKKAEQLGRGASAKVYKVMWLGTPVAKKTFVGPENQEFLQEVKILSELCHPNTTSMFCCNTNKRSCSIIMELMDGSLHDMMQSRLEENNDSPPFTILEGVDIMLQVGEGVNYLHSKRIVHRDLKSMNILVKSVEASDLELGCVQAKVVDFGLSKTKESSTTYSNMTYNTGTFRWMAPEVINIVAGNEKSLGGSIELPKHKFKCDIYSFGMVCFEILTGEVPFICEKVPRNVKEKVLKGFRPEIPDYCPSMLKSLIEKCWSQEPMERPSIGDVCSQLKYLKYLLMTSKSFQPQPLKALHFYFNLKWIYAL
jgi:tRNA A-37 threonylcarbamoyl transferase component Bud32